MPSAAGAATVLIRFCTLWFGVLLGALAFFLTARRYLLAAPPGPLSTSSEGDSRGDGGEVVVGGPA